MIKLRSLLELTDFLDQDIGWRRTELQAIRGEVSHARGRTKEVLRRAAIAMLYAHWEGFLKSAAEAYLTYVAECVSRKRIKSDELSPGMRSICAWKHFNKLGMANSASRFIETLTPFFSNEDSKLVNLESAIETRSNLSAEVLREIVRVVGIVYTEFEKKEKIIDQKLLKTRNEIVHGRNTQVSDEDFTELFDNIIELIAHFKTEIENAAATSLFKKAS